MAENPAGSTPSPQYSMVFLAGSFGLTEAEAKVILDQAGQDRLTAAELARLHNAGRR
jgi:hypothetical protein